MDFTPDFQLVSGRDALVQALWRRWTTDRGSLIDDPNYGTNLTNAINDDMSPGDIHALQSAAEAEALKDERVLAINSSATLDDEGTLNLTFEITDGAGPFSLTISIDEVSVEILQVAA